MKINRRILGRFFNGSVDTATGIEITRQILDPVNQSEVERYLDEELSRAMYDDGRGAAKVFSLPATFIQRISICAAAVLLIIGGAYLFSKGDAVIRQNQLVVAKKMEAITLADRSIVSLQPGTELFVADSFGLMNRIVKLRKGVAAFDVRKKNGLPFTVITDALNVVVTGTAFTVRSIRGNSSVVVSHGSVKVSLADIDGAQKYLSLRKNDSIHLFQSTSVSSLATNIDGSRLFTIRSSDAPVSEIIGAVAMHTGQQIILPDHISSECRLNLSLSYSSADEFLHLVEPLIDIQHHRKGRTVIVSAIKCR